MRLAQTRFCSKPTQHRQRTPSIKPASARKTAAAARTKRVFNPHTDNRLDKTYTEEESNDDLEILSEPASKSSSHQNASSSSTTVASTGSKRRVFNPRGGNRLDKTYTEADSSDDGDIEVSVLSSRKRTSRAPVDVAPSLIGMLKPRNATTKVAAADPVAITRSMRRKK
ncbi:unnamed protein product [Sphagnum balticum]